MTWALHQSVKDDAEHLEMLKYQRTTSLSSEVSLNNLLIDCAIENEIVVHSYVVGNPRILAMP